MLNCDDAAAPRKGTRPGEGLADFAFCAAFQKPFAQIRDALRARGLLFAAPVPVGSRRLAPDAPPADAGDAPFADDAAIMLELPCDQEMEVAQRWRSRNGRSA